MGQLPATCHVYIAAGSPPLGDVPGVCRSCGIDGVGLPFDDWVKRTFVDFDKLQPGSIVCSACLFCFDDRNPNLTALTGRDKLQRMRTYSHFVSGGVWSALHKGQKVEMRDRLLDPATEVAVVSLSGQKHLLFRARPGWWQIEEEATAPFPSELRRLMAAVDELLAVFSKREIESGRWSQSRILKFGPARWMELERAIKPARGTIRLELAVFLGQKEECGTGEDSEGPAVSDVAGDQPGLPVEVPADHLGPVRKPDTKQRLHQLAFPLDG